MTTSEHRAWLKECTGVVKDSKTIDEVHAFAMRLKSLDDTIGNHCSTKVLVFNNVDDAHTAILIVWHQVLENQVSDVLRLF